MRTDCRGDLREEAPAFYRSVFESAKSCVDDARGDARGTVMFHATLEVGGGFSEFSVTKDGLGNPKVIECLQNAMFSASYPDVAKDAPCVQLHVPVIFD